MVFLKSITLSPIEDMALYIYVAKSLIIFCQWFSIRLEVKDHEKAVVKIKNLDSPIKCYF